MFSGSTSIKGTATRTNVSVTGSRAAIAVLNGNRKSLMIQNQGTDTVFLGGSDVATSGAGRGYALFAGATFTDDATNTEWWAVANSGTQILHIEEVS
jgi:hypothetical protein